MTDRPTRRDALRTLGRCAGCALALPAVSGCTVSRVFGGAGEDVAFDLSAEQWAPLRAVGGLVPVDSGARKLVLIRVTESDVVALDRICTHQDCDMHPAIDGEWDGEVLTCVCHDSRFSTTGEVLSGPANAPLEQFEVTFDPQTGAGVVRVGPAPPDEDPPLLVLEPNADGEVVVELADAPALADPGGMAAVDTTTLDGTPKKLLVIRVDAATVATVGRLCTHTLCDMAPDISGRFEDGVLVCTCHDSRFSTDGEVLQGPAVLPLQSFPSALDAAAGRVTVQVS